MTFASTHPVCRGCWDRGHPGREPHRLLSAEAEVCCLCGERTTAGIYIRADPATIAYGRGTSQ